IAQIETEAAAEAAPAPAATQKPAPAPAPVPAAAAPAPAPGPSASADGARQRFSPAVRRLAEEHGIDPSTLTGTGEGGRVTRDDVLAFVQKGGTAGPSPAAPAGRTSPPSGEEPRPSSPQPSPPSGEESREELVRI